MLDKVARFFGLGRETKYKENSHFDDSLYSPMKKLYVFNETGNIMLSATKDSIHDFDEEIKDSFIDISVFFSAMTKAIYSVKNEKNENRPFSIYNYDVVKEILQSSGMFIEVNVEEGVFKSKNVGTKIGKEFVQTILNRDFADSRINFSRSMFNGMNYQQGKDGDSKQLRTRCGHIFFICESLLGLPQTSAILTKIEPLSQEGGKKDLIQFGKEEDKESKGNVRQWTYKKRTYLFVPPKFFKKNVSNLSDEDSVEYSEMITKFSNRIRAMIKTEGN